MYVLLLKSAGEYASCPEEDPYYQILSKSGFTVSLVETLDFSYHLSSFSEHKNWRDTCSCIIFTSPRAVNAFTKAGLKGSENDICFVVGPSTETQAKKAGFAPKGSQCGDATSLAQYIVSNFAAKLQKPVFFPTGRVHRDILVQTLESHDIKVNTVIAYSSEENANLKEKLRLNLCEGNPIPDCLVFFSPSGVSFTETILKNELKPYRPKIKLVAMGRATASRLEELEMKVAGIASSPKPESLLSVMKQLSA